MTDKLQKSKETGGMAKRHRTLPVCWQLQVAELCVPRMLWLLSLHMPLCVMDSLATSCGFHKAVALHAVDLAVTHRARNWVRGLQQQLSAVGYHFDLHAGAMHAVEMGALRSKLLDQRAAAWAGLPLCPRSCLAQGARLCTYWRWFARPSDCKTDLLRVWMPARLQRALLRLRTGSHSLPNVLGSMAGVPRLQRFCPLCGGPFPDEQHVLLECASLAWLRERFSPLFQRPLRMREFVWQADMLLLAQYVAAVLDAVDEAGPRQGSDISSARLAGQM